MHYNCCNCCYTASSVEDFSKHQYRHKNDKNAKFLCALCFSCLGSYDSLRVHMNRFHKKTTDWPKSTNTNLSSTPSFICSFENCSFCSVDFKIAKAHCYDHFEKSKFIICPYVTCQKHFLSKNHFNVHVFRFHNTKKLSSTPDTLISPVIDDPIPSTSNNESKSSEEFVRSQRPDSPHENTVLSLALKLKTQHFTSEKVIQCVVDDILHFDENIKSSIAEKIDQICQKHNAEHLREILTESFADFGCLKEEEKVAVKTSHRRNKSFKSSRHYVKPVQIYIGRDNNHKKCHYHYVPVSKTISNFCNDPSVNFSTSSTFNQNLPTSVLKDFSHGSVFKEDCNTEDITIIMYQDAFELCIVIASARKRYKMVGVYMAFAQMDKYHRYLVDNIQLVLLCRNIHIQRFGISKILERSISDLKALETNGVKVNGQIKNVKIIGSIGDNLGQHEIGGFCQNFSTNNFPCRYCYTTTANLKNFDYCVKEERSIPKHIRDIKHLEEIPNSIPHKGIKFDSILNQLKKFHICQPGLPPCIAHDLFEGIFQYDLIILIHHFSTSKNNFYDYLNMSLSSLSSILGMGISFPEITSKSKKLPGKAYENWQFLVLLPYVLMGLDIDRNSNEWLMFANLLD
jgi:hypothetical protein